MTEQVNKLRAFNHLTVMKTPFETIYRLLYTNTVHYFKVKDDQEYLLLRSDGSIYSGADLSALYEKIRVYERLFTNSLQYERMNYFLRINEAKFLLEELEMNYPELEERLYQRLLPHVEHQIRQRSYNPLLLPKVLTHNEFIFNYLQTNIGHPDTSENYFNRMKIMIQQINEHTQYNDVKDYFIVLQSLLIFINRRSFSTSNVIISSYDSYCVIKAGFDTINPKFHQLLGKSNNFSGVSDTTILDLNNEMISELISIYNSLE